MHTHCFMPLPEKVRRFSNASDAVRDVGCLECLGFWGMTTASTMIRCKTLHGINLTWVTCSFVQFWVLYGTGLLLELSGMNMQRRRWQLKLPIFRQDQLLYCLHVFVSWFDICLIIFLIVLTSCYFLVSDSCVLHFSVPFPLLPKVPAMIPEAEEVKFDPLAPWFKWWTRWCCRRW